MAPKHDVDIPLYSIGTAARLLKVSVATLRLYERRGLILARKSPGRQRFYSASDLERIRCLRSAITEEKISIEGIRRIQSMIPCWENVRCPPDQRRICPAFTDARAGCWTHRHTANVCSDRDCLRCVVYELSGDCTTIKSLLHQRPDLLTGATTPLAKESDS
jgi:MerR family transcriptional regulator, heat shock protein HspR